MLSRWNELEVFEMLKFAQRLTSNTKNSEAQNVEFSELKTYRFIQCTNNIFFAITPNLQRHSIPHKSKQQDNYGRKWIADVSWKKAAD